MIVKGLIGRTIVNVYPPTEHTGVGVRGRKLHGGAHKFGADRSQKHGVLRVMAGRSHQRRAEGLHEVSAEVMKVENEEGGREDGSTAEQIQADEQNHDWPRRGTSQGPLEGEVAPQTRLLVSHTKNADKEVLARGDVVPS